MEGGRKIISPILLLVDVREANLNTGLPTIHLQVCGEEEKGRTTHAHSPHRAWRSEAKGEGSRHVCEWSIEIQPKASQVHDFLL
jgi:hypothetical protein